MPPFKNRVRARLLASVALSGAFLFSSASAATPEAPRPVQFQIPSEDLSSALKRYALQSDRQVIFSDTVGSGIRTPVISGRYTPEQALQLLLRGTDFTATVLNSGVVSVRRTPHQPMLQPASLRMQAPAEASSAPSAQPQAADRSTALEEVVVTGSRLATGFDMPTPVSVVEAEALTAAAPNNIGESLSQLPSLAGSIQNSTSGQGSANSQVNGQNLLDLRQLGPERTLILLNGQRLGVTNVVGSVDINIVPQGLVKRVDVVTGGASASYGSDAVAGVVNFVLDTEFEGLKIDLNAGQTTYGDVPNGKVNVTFGKQFGDNLRVVGGVEYYKAQGIDYGEVTGRDWFDRPTMSVANATGQSPRWLLIPDARSRVGSYGGTITALTGCSTPACSALVNQQFTPTGATAPFQIGTNAFGNNQYASGGDGATVNQPFSPDSERKSLFLHGEYKVNDALTLWAEGSYNASETFLQAQVLQVQTNSQFRIYEDNPFLPANVRQALLADPGLDSFSLTRFNRDMGFNEVTGNTSVKRFAAGAKGGFDNGWSYDVIFGHQDTLQELDVRTALTRNLYAAAEAVVHPTTGQIVCRSQFYRGDVFVPGGTGLDAGCVPANLFGDGRVSAEATNYIMGLNTADVRLKQSTFDANLRGDTEFLFSLPAGPISFATGVNYRRLTATRTVDANSAILKDGTGIRGYPTALQGSIGGYTYYNPSPVAGEVSVSEGYGEIGIPIFKDKPFIQDFAATLAGRVTDYSQSGVVKTWKAGLNWTVNDSIRFRGTVSKDIRAPTVIELFNTAQVSRGTYTLPSTNAPSTFTGAGQNVMIGNPELMPEEAKTYVAGVVLSPSFLPNFRASLDWYKINLLGSIEQPINQDTLDQCYNGDAFSCSLIRVNGQAITTTRNIGVNDFVEITLPLLNQESDRFVEGLDFEATYSTPVFGNDLDLRLTGSYLLKDFNPGAGCAVSLTGTNKEDVVGTIGSGSATCGISPRIRARLSAKYDVGPFGIYVQERYIHGGKRNPNYVEGVDINDNDVPAVWYTDVTLNYDLPSVIGAESQLYLNVTNLFDQEPPPTNSTAGRSWIDVSELGLYDGLGRRFVVGLRMQW